MGILGKIFKADKADHLGNTNSSKVKTQRHYFDAILGEKALYERVGALCSMDILDRFIPLSDIEEGQYTYSVNGTVFAEDGGGGYYILLCDGSVGYINVSEDECGRVAESVKDLLELELNCAYSWHNYLNMKYFKDPSLLKKDAPRLEAEGREQFEDAYGDEMPDYAELQKEIASRLDLSVSTDITKDVLPRLYRSVQKQPEFTAASKTGNIPLGKLYR